MLARTAGRAVAVRSVALRMRRRLAQAGDEKVQLQGRLTNLRLPIAGLDLPSLGGAE